MIPMLIQLLGDMQWNFIQLLGDIQWLGDKQWF